MNPPNYILIVKLSFKSVNLFKLFVVETIEGGGSEITFKKASQVNLDESILDSSLLYFNIVTRKLEEATSKVKELNLSSSTSLKEIGYRAFYKSQITSLSIPDSVTTIGEDVFSSNQISGELIIPDSVTVIGASAFSGNQISSLTLGESVTIIEESVFSQNQINGKLIIPDSVTTMENHAFSYNQISNLIIPSSVTRIDSYAFKSQNSKLLSILIKRTEEDFLENVTVGTDWYDNTLNPTITYDPS